MSRREFIWKPLVKWAIILGVLGVLRLVLPLLLDPPAEDVAKFVTVFFIVVFAFISIGVNFTGRVLRQRIPLRFYRIVEYTMMAGIIGGVLCVFQPWSVDVYRTGWLVLLVAFFFFIVWTHITPANAEPVESQG